VVLTQQATLESAILRSLDALATMQRGRLAATSSCENNGNLLEMKMFN
jgi:hypothetical protein